MPIQIQNRWVIITLSFYKLNVLSFGNRALETIHEYFYSL